MARRRPLRTFELFSNNVSHVQERAPNTVPISLATLYNRFKPPIIQPELRVTNCPLPIGRNVTTHQPVPVNEYQPMLATLDENAQNQNMGVDGEEGNKIVLTRDFFTRMIPLSLVS